MRKARHTGSIVITSRVLSDLVDYSTDPTLLREMLRRAASLISVPYTERFAAVEALDEFCRQAPCLLWQPHVTMTRHVECPVRNVTGPGVLVSVSRVIWTAFHVIPEQGNNQGVGRDEEILHTCGNNGRPNTGYDTCLNPSHLILANQDLRMELARTRRVMRANHIPEVRA